VSAGRESRRLKPLTEALEDHGAEGIAILTEEPWRGIEATVLAVAALIVTAVIW
jgi:hemolysin D